MVELYKQVCKVDDSQADCLDYYQRLYDKGVYAVIVNLTSGNRIINQKARTQALSAREAGMLVHYYHKATFTNMNEARAEADFFLNEIQSYLIDDDVVLSVDVTGYDKIPPYMTSYIRAFLERIGEVRNNRMDIQVTAESLWNEEIIQSELSSYNLWVRRFNVSHSGIERAGSWEFTPRWMGIDGIHMAYDFFGFYTEENGQQGFQLSLDGEYICRPGDNYWLVAKQHGISVQELATMNALDLSKNLTVGQKLRVA